MLRCDQDLLKSPVIEVLCQCRLLIPWLRVPSWFVWNLGVFKSVGMVGDKNPNSWILALSVRQDAFCPNINNFDFKNDLKNGFYHLCNTIDIICCQALFKSAFNNSIFILFGLNFTNSFSILSIKFLFYSHPLYYLFMKFNK